MTNPNGDQHLSRTLANCLNSKERLDLEHKILQSAFKRSFEQGDKAGAAVAHKGLMAIIQQQLFNGDGSSTGSVIPKSFWDRVNTAAESQAAAKEATTEQPPVAESTAQEPPPSVTEKIIEERSSAIKVELAAVVVEAQPLMTQAVEQEWDGLEQPQLVTDQETPGGGSASYGGGPSSYLDFGDNESTAPPTPGIQVTISEAGSDEARPSELIKTQSLYQMLGLNNLSSFDEIHAKFLLIIRRLLRRRYAADSPAVNMREFREVLRTICVAHDILKDPITRTDYDLRQMGMRQTQAQNEQAQAEQIAAGLTTGIRLMLGELLECAKILDPTELEIALDMHKAEPGIQFGEFLVRSGFLNRDELDSALLAQRLISAGKITVAQFRTSMARMREEGAPFRDTLVIEGWVSSPEIFNENSDMWMAESTHCSNEHPSNVLKAEPPPWINGEDLVNDNVVCDDDALSTSTKEAVSAMASANGPAENQALDTKALRSLVEAEATDTD